MRIESEPKTKKENQCGFCGAPILEVLDNFCSKKCKELNEITDSIQKIAYCVELLKRKLEPASDKKISELTNLLEKYSTKISENIISIRDQPS